MPHYSQRHTQQNLGARDLWRRGRRPNQPATFRPGEELRCPGRLRIGQSDEVCGGSFNEYANPHNLVIIRIHTARRQEIPEAGTNGRCHKCGTLYEKVVILEEAG